MKLNSNGLSAFFEVAVSRTFTQAASRLAITQSALSQRIAALESELETTLIIRDPKGLRLTPAGERLLQYCQISRVLEEEVLSELTDSRSSIRSNKVLRVASFSSVLRSVLLPSLSKFLRDHSQIVFDLQVFEVAELEEVLRSAKSDFVVADFRIGKPGIEEVLLGHEEYVVIESAKYKTPADLFLDHDPDDQATDLFFRAQKGHKPPKRKSFLGDVYGIICGVEEGLGRAVVSRHLIVSNTKVRPVKGFQSLQREIVLHYFKQPYYTELHRTLVELLNTNVPRYLPK